MASTSIARASRDGDRITIQCDGGRVRPRPPVVTALLALETDETLLIGKIAFLVLLYLFIVYVVRSATGDESGAAEEHHPGRRRNVHFAPSGLPADPAARPGEPRARLGETIAVTAPMVVGQVRAASAWATSSSLHAMRIEPRPDGAMVDDLGSTNGTFVNGSKLEKARLAKAGDVIKIGATELQVRGANQAQPG